MFIYQDDYDFGKVKGREKARSPACSPPRRGAGSRGQRRRPPSQGAKPSAVTARQPGELAADAREDLLPKAAFATKAIRRKTYSVIKVHFGKIETSTGGH